jgi:transposase
MNQMHDNTSRSKRYANGPDLEPLATYLDSRFGDIYAYNFTSDDAGREIQRWTDELRASVQQYLSHEMTNDAYEALLDELFYGVPDAPREAQAESIIDHHQAWEIAYACHIVAVKALPTLTDLIDEQSHAWESEDQKVDVARWLQAHADYEQLKAMASVARLSSPVTTDGLAADSDEAIFVAGDLAFQLPMSLSLHWVVAAWENAVGPASTDLTDEEWVLLEHLIPKRKNASPPDIVRQAMNGMLYRHAHQGEHRTLPGRYGEKFTVSSRAYNYRKTGVFARMLAALQGKSGAESVEAWLREMVQ